MSFLNKTSSELTVKDGFIINGISIAIAAVPLIGAMVYAHHVERRQAKKNADNTAYKAK